MSSDSIKIQTIAIKRFKKLTDFTQDFHGQSVIIMGPNEVGKTSLQQYIKAMLGDDSAIPPSSFPEGELTFTKGDKTYTIRGEISGGKKRLVVCFDGMEDNRKGTLIDLVGATSFNPFDFVKKSETKSGRKEQVEDIKALLPEEVRNDLAKFEADVASKYEERTGLGKDLKSKKGFIEQHPLYNDSHNLDAFKSVNLSELQAKKDAERTRLNELYKTNKAGNDKLMADWNEAKETIDKECYEHNLEQTIVEEKIAKAKKLLDELFTVGYSGNEVNLWISSKEKTIQPIKVAPKHYPAEPTYITEMPDDKELQAIDALILSASEANAKYKDAQDLKKKIAEVAALEDQVGDLTVAIELGRESISGAIKEMANVVDGLAFDAEGLTLNGIPVHPNSLSTSQIIQLAYKIKMFENPYTPILVDCIESMDQTKYDALLAIAKEHDVQIIGAEVKRDLEKMEFHLIES